MREIIIASHEKLAVGMLETLTFLTGEQKNIHTLCAYLDNKPIDEQVAQLMNGFSEDDQIIVFTDLLAGSVNQKFAEYRQRENIKIIAGMNLPLIMGIILLPDDKWLTDEEIEQMIDEARMQIQFVSQIDTDLDEDDE